ncbi:hypothetical protein DL96DRAFT_1563649 [Flagelloscypha sp. PMI_526]|nr:hypothetical protein DL96DRAFT_1563649 [Flagelloscypha sp. PMI_526]
MHAIVEEEGSVDEGGDDSVMDTDYTTGGKEEDEVEVDESGSQGARTFCPEPFRKRMLEMVEDAYYAHPLPPGEVAPNQHAIYEWAVERMHTMCKEKDLPELWAYLWEKWYRPGRWELCMILQDLARS